MRILFLLFIPALLYSSNKDIFSPFTKAACQVQEITVLVRSEYPCSKKTEAGFVLSPDGYIVTLYPNVKNAKAITVELSDGNTYDATLIGGDRHSEIALLKIDLDHLPFLPLGNSIELGEWALSAGYPFYRIAVKTTLIAGFKEKKEQSFLLIDKPFNPGDFGGPLINLKGEVIGINYSNIDSYQPLGIAIPSQTLCFILEQILEQNFFTVLP